MAQGLGSRGIFTWNDKDCSDLCFYGSDRFQSSLIVDGVQSLEKEQLVDGFEQFDARCKRIKLMPLNERQQITVPLNLSSEENKISSPLGLTLKKTPSLLELVEMKLSQGRLTHTGTMRNTSPRIEKASNNDFPTQPAAEKLKASNFPATLLRIGSWERVSRYEGDLVAKCYYAKQKLVWEVLDGGLKSKIEIQWSAITALKATFRENEPSILEIELCHAPLFFRETNPQPRKHTLWQATSDFTGGQAPTRRRHFLQFPESTLEKHYEKLLQCDCRLNLLSKKPFPSSGSLYFDSRSNEYEDYSYDCKQEFAGFHHTVEDRYSPQHQNFSITRAAAVDLCQRVLKSQSVRPVTPVEESNSPNSVFELPCLEETSTEVCKEQQIQGLDSTIMNPVTNSPKPLSHFLPRQFSYNFLYSEDGSEGFSSNKKVLDEIAEHFLSDSLVAGCADERKVIAKVNSMCCLIDGALQQQDSMNTGIKIEESDNKNCMNNLVVSRNNNQSDLGDGYFSRNLANLMPPVQELDVLAQVPRMQSYPNLFFEQVEDFGAGEPNYLWNQWR